MPSIHGAVDKSSDGSSIFQQQSRNSSIVGPESESDKNESQKEANSSKEPKRLVLSNQKAKPQTMPLDFAEAPVTPKKKKFDSGEE